MGKSIKETMQEFTVNQALNYLEGNPEENIPKLMSFVDRFMPKDWYASPMRSSGNRRRTGCGSRATRKKGRSWMHDAV